MDEDFRPPNGPPPLLTFKQTSHLAIHGWIRIDLDDSFAHDLHLLSTAASTFFEQSHQEKTALYSPSGGTESGFYHVPNEKEYITFRHSLHPDTGLEQHVKAVWHQAGALLHRILCDLSKAADLAPTVWDHLLEDSLELPSNGSDIENIISFLRIFRYYPIGGYATEHVDIGLLTLCVGAGHGLQMLDRSTHERKWIDADGPIILIGDFGRALLRNRVRAGLHRVTGNPQGRHSTVFALRPCLRYPTDLAAFGGEGVVDTSELFHRIKSSKFNVNAIQEVRERQRKVQEETRAKAWGGRQSPPTAAG